MARLEDTLTHLDINLGDACNLKCAHCPCWINESAPHYDPAVLEAKLTEAVDYVARECPRFDKVMLIGGEPFVHDGVIQFLKNQRLDATIAVYTNFVWPDVELSLPENVHFLSSLDAPRQSIYGQIRRTRDFERSQEVMRRNGKQIFHVDTTVSKFNVAHLKDILAITEPFGCSHWFLPVDPRVFRYSNRLHAGNATKSEIMNTERTAKRVEAMLLDDDDIARISEFFEHNTSSRTNTFDMFMGVYNSGIEHFREDEFDYHKETVVKMPTVGEVRCAGIRRYMEISFTADGRFIPMIHCPELWDLLSAERGPGLDTFREVMEWENQTRIKPKCDVFCGRTQFLGLDEYEQTFQEVAAERVDV